MRRAATTFPTAATARLGLWALVGLTAHAGAAQVAGPALGWGQGEAAAAAWVNPSRCCVPKAPAASPSPAWPYARAEASPPPRPVRVIAIDAAPQVR
jgi:hypothetical protein